MALSRADIPQSVWPKEQTVPVTILGGEVIVRPLLLWERLQWLDRRDESFKHIAQLLALAVVDGNHEPLMSAEEWEQFGGVHHELALDLFNTAWNLGGLNGAAVEKKSQAESSSSP